MAKVLVLDVYPSVPYRVSKDTNGGFGTANDFGDSIFCQALKRTVRWMVDWPPLHAIYSLSVLRDHGHDVAYARTCPANLDTYDYVIVPSSVVAHETEVEAARQAVNAGARVFAIGPFSTAMPQPYVEAGAKVILGEPEVYFHANGLGEDTFDDMPDIVINDTRLDLDELPYPAWDIVFDNYRPRNRFLVGRKLDMIPILASRGCPYSCFHYCTYPLQQGRKVRLRDPEAVVAEMAYWQDKLGVDVYLFRDPVFSINRKHTMAFCKAIENSGRRFRFIIETHLKNLDDELTGNLKRAGLEMVFVGIESVDPVVLTRMKRHTIEQEQQMARIRDLQSKDIRIKATFIFGSPADTEESCTASLDFARTILPDFAQFSVFTPYPGTPVYQEYKDRITAKSYENYTQWHLVFRHDNLSPQKIRKLVDTAYRRYYTNPKWVGRFVSSVFKPSHAHSYHG